MKVIKEDQEAEIKNAILTKKRVIKFGDLKQRYFDLWNDISLYVKAREQKHDDEKLKLELRRLRGLTKKVDFINFPGIKEPWEEDNHEEVFEMVNYGYPGYEVQGIAETFLRGYENSQIKYLSDSSGEDQSTSGSGERESLTNSRGRSGNLSGNRTRTLSSGASDSNEGSRSRSRSGGSGSDGGSNGSGSSGRDSSGVSGGSGSKGSGKLPSLGRKRSMRKKESSSVVNSGSLRPSGNSDSQGLETDSKRLRTLQESDAISSGGDEGDSEVSGETGSNENTSQQN